MAKFTLDKLDEILESIKGLKIKEAISLKNRLQKEKEKLVPKVEPQEINITKEEKQQLANQKRSRKQSKYWNYIKLIRDRFPHLKTKDIRAQLRERRKGKKTKIPDAVWQNPSG
jgi:hypothetical protein